MTPIAVVRIAVQPCNYTGAKTVLVLSARTRFDSANHSFGADVKTFISQIA